MTPDDFSSKNPSLIFVLTRLDTMQVAVLWSNAATVIVRIWGIACNLFFVVI